MPLSLAGSGKEVILITISGGRGLRARLNSMGLNEGMRFKVVHSHYHGPCVILVGNTRLVLGYGMIQKILVRLLANEGGENA